MNNRELYWAPDQIAGDSDEAVIGQLEKDLASALKTIEAYRREVAALRQRLADVGFPHP